MVGRHSREGVPCDGVLLWVRIIGEYSFIASLQGGAGIIIKCIGNGELIGVGWQYLKYSIA